MSALDSALRRPLERAIVEARRVAERGAEKALRHLGVQADEPPRHLDPSQRVLRRRLRAARQGLGGDTQLLRACAYAYWHRMLFARFLAENNLLIHPVEQVAVTLDECEELARAGAGADRWEVAAGFAAGMLPGIFPQDDPIHQVPFAAEDRVALEAVLDGMAPEVFVADDGLGWTYQYWQSQRKAEVNASGLPVQGDDIAAVTQLFTEHYMVQFLLQNTLGAWWLSRHPDSPLRQRWAYYRPEAEHDFSAWPEQAAEVTIMDPCCGSGHFLVEAFQMLLAMREEEGQTREDAALGVLQENLFGLEIDARCVQIAAFALAMATWKAGVDPVAPLPIPNLACSGLRLAAREPEWRALADGDLDLANALGELHQRFAEGPDLGSLLEPLDRSGMIPFAGEPEVRQHLERALAEGRNVADPVAGVFGRSARGLLRASHLMGRQFHLVVTNPPFMLRRGQAPSIRAYCDRSFPTARKDLATCFLLRARGMVFPSCHYAFVIPNNWTFLGTDRPLRAALLASQRWLFFSRLGARAFGSISGEVVRVGLVGLQNRRPPDGCSFTGIDVGDLPGPAEKAAMLRAGPWRQFSQHGMLLNPDARIVLSLQTAGRPLANYADVSLGLQTGDYPCFARCFWELPSRSIGWEFLQRAGGGDAFGGRSEMVAFHVGDASVETTPWAVIRGAKVWGKRGVAISLMSSLTAQVYLGDKFDQTLAVISPRRPGDLPALWAFTRAPEFAAAVRAIDQKLNVTSGTLGKVPVDFEYWQAEAERARPLPAPHSDDPTQWLFRGEVVGGEAPLQVAVARLLGYRWPEQPERDQLDGFAVPDGIVCLPAVAGEAPAVDRLRSLLATAYHEAWNVAQEDALLQEAGYRGKGLEAWLRDGFFEQHCRLFHHRPFIWHVWDGRPDGFSALVNYHRLDYGNLQKLIFTYLGAWINRQQADARAGRPGAEPRLAAAQGLREKLGRILEGEAPYDIYVRWKTMAQQPIGWHPDLNDGVRLNIRPFVTAGVLRGKVNVKWGKDRGRNPDGSERINDIHLTLAEKRHAQGQTP